MAPLPGPSPFSFTGISSSKSFAHIFPSWYLLLGRPREMAVGVCGRTAAKTILHAKSSQLVVAAKSGELRKILGLFVVPCKDAMVYWQGLP